MARQKGRHTQEEWFYLIGLCGNKCVKCGREFLDCELPWCQRRFQVQKDHIVPLFLGGSDGIFNLQPLCMRCNIGKRSETIDWRPRGVLEAVLRAWGDERIEYENETEVYLSEVWADSQAQDAPRYEDESQESGSGNVGQEASVAQNYKRKN